MEVFQFAYGSQSPEANTAEQQHLDKQSPWPGLPLPNVMACAIPSCSILWPSQHYASLATVQPSFALRSFIKKDFLFPFLTGFRLGLF